MKILKSDLLKFTRLFYSMRRSQIFEREVNLGGEARKVLEQLVDLELMRMGVDVEKVKRETKVRRKLKFFRSIFKTLNQRMAPPIDKGD